MISVKDSPYGALGDGTTDDTAALQSAINAGAAAGEPVWLPPGRYVITSPLNLPDGLVLRGEEDPSLVVLVSQLDPVGASDWVVPLLATWRPSLGTTTVAEATAPNATSLVVADNVGGALAVGATMVVRSGTFGFSAGMYIVEGVTPNPDGTYTVGLPRPLRRRFGPGDTVGINAGRPHRVQVYGLTITGPCTRGAELGGIAGLDFRNVVFVGLQTTSQDDAISLGDTYSLDGLVEDVAYDATGNDGVGGFLSEQGEGYVWRRVRVRGARGVGGANPQDCVDYVYEDCEVTESANGIVLGTSGTAANPGPGCLGIHVLRGRYSSNAGGGVVVGWGTTDTRLTDVDGRSNAIGLDVRDAVGTVSREGRWTDCGRWAIYVHGPARGTTLDGDDISGSAGGILVEGPADLDARSIRHTGPLRYPAVAVSSTGDTTLRGARLCPTGGGPLGAVVAVGAGTTRILDSVLTADRGSNLVMVTGGRLVLEGVIAAVQAGAQGGAAIYAPAPCAIEIGEGCDLSGCTYGLVVAPGVSVTMAQRSGVAMVAASADVPTVLMWAQYRQRTIAVTGSGTIVLPPIACVWEVTVEPGESVTCAASLAQSVTTAGASVTCGPGLNRVTWNGAGMVQA
jgi:hypothetical protein